MLNIINNTKSIFLIHSLTLSVKQIVPTLLAYLNAPSKVDYIEMKHSNSIILQKMFSSTILNKVYHICGRVAQNLSHV